MDGVRGERTDRQARCGGASTRPATRRASASGVCRGDSRGAKVDPVPAPASTTLSHDMIDAELAERLMRRAPSRSRRSRFMRGSHPQRISFIVPREAPEHTPAQMKTVADRLGFGSKAVITGRITRTTGPRGQKSGMSDGRGSRTSGEFFLDGFFQRSGDVVRASMSRADPSLTTGATAPVRGPRGQQHGGGRGRVRASKVGEGDGGTAGACRRTAPIGRKGRCDEVASPTELARSRGCDADGSYRVRRRRRLARARGRRQRDRFGIMGALRARGGNDQAKRHDRTGAGRWATRLLTRRGR